MKFLIKKIALKVLRSGSFVWPVIAISILFALLFVYLLSIKEVNILPDKINYSCGYYTDKANGGNSQILNYVASDSIIKIDFNLSEGFLSPYVGISLTPIKEKFIDARKYNQIQLELKGQGIERLGVSIYNPPVILSKNQKQDQTLFHSYLNITDKTETYRIPLKQLEAPEWWKDLHGIPDDIKFSPDLSRILHLNIGSAYSPNVNTTMSIEIYSIKFSRDNRQLFAVMGAFELLAVLVLFLVHYLVFLFKSKKEEITILYQPLNVQEKENLSESYIDYISKNYQNNELTLELIAKETSISQRRIAQAIHSKFNCNFKTYINKIRINESTRFLQQTDLNIGEIAFKVGFNNQSNFNRVFKNELLISPSEYREKYKSQHL
jgi:AraC-like DNA-binding protein